MAFESELEICSGLLSPSSAGIDRVKVVKAAVFLYNAIALRIYLQIAFPFPLRGRHHLIKS